MACCILNGQCHQLIGRRSAEGCIHRDQVSLADPLSSHKAVIVLMTDQCTVRRTGSITAMP